MPARATPLPIGGWQTPRMDDPTAALLDELASNAVASSVVRRVDGWLLRADPELPFRRCNAVLPFASSTVSLPLERRIDLVEGFYRDRDAPARFQLLAGHGPADLDAVLDGRGYEVEAPVTVLTGTAVGGADHRGLPPVRLGTDLDDAWLRDYRRAWDDDGTAGRRAAAYATVVRRLGAGGVLATVDLDGAPAGIGVGAVERGWLGLFGLATRPEARGRGVGTAVVGSLLRWGRGEGATGAYLQVEEANTTARSLFATVGFSPHHRYHYRILRPVP